MTDASWELYDSLIKSLHRQGRRIDDLESRCTSLERQLRERNPEAEVFGERNVVRMVEPDQSHLCPRCERYHSPELPCVTPANQAWAAFGKEVTT